MYKHMYYLYAYLVEVRSYISLPKIENFLEIRLDYDDVMLC